MGSSSIAELPKMLMGRTVRSTVRSAEVIDERAVRLAVI
jgi:hypothetical protein